MTQKIYQREDLLPLLRERQQRGEKAVLTNGCFDLLHVGHLRTLQAARAEGDFLIVGLNTDRSVKRFKGDTRPLVPEAERAEMLAGFACVDYVVLFDERTAAPLVEFLRPDVYVKSEEYRDKPLPEADVVRAYGGRVAFVPICAGFSTTTLIERIRSRPHSPVPPPPHIRNSQFAIRNSQRMVFLDRDGVLNENRSDYVKTPAELVLLPGAAEAVARLNREGYPVVVITNQSALGRGLLTTGMLDAIHVKLRRELAAQGAAIAAIYHCPHRPDEGCPCRKPRPLLLQQAAQDFGGDLAQSVFIGDSGSDLAAARAAGCRTVLVRTGLGGEQEAFACQQWRPDCVAEDLAEAVEWFLREEEKRAT